MKLSGKAFDTHFANGTLRLAIIGMSNIGKSYTATRLRDTYGFDLVEVDNLIWATLGHSSMDEFAEWQGQPYEEGYAEREQLSIELESKATHKAISLTQNDEIKGNSIIDTPGSIIYTDTGTLKSLYENCFILHIRANTRDMDRLKSDYFANPKPLVWAGHFTNDPSLSDRENILDSFPILLKARAKRYKELANATLDSDFILNPDVTIEEIFKAIRP